MPKILALSGSLRTGSYNTSLLEAAIRLLDSRGAKVERFDFRADPLPIFDADLEAADGYPDNVLKLKAAVREADAVVIAGPEYNSGPTPLLKNAIDWVSRKSKDRGARNEWDKKVVAVISASDGRFGGIRAQMVYRNSLSFIGAHVLPGFVAVTFAKDAFDEQGNLLDERANRALERTMTDLLEVSCRLRDQ